jgi:hypothetical protein
LASSNRLRVEVTQVTLEVGSQGKSGGQAHVLDADGVLFEVMHNVRLPFGSSSPWDWCD